MELTLNDWLFVGEYVKDWKPKQALLRAGFYDGKFAANEAYRRMKKPAVALEINRIREEMRRTVQLNTSLVVQDIVNVLAADPRDLYEIINGACRYCHGINHDRQLTRAEMAAEEFEAMLTKKPFHSPGGTGFNPYADPHPDCPECHGRGETIERIKDVRELTPEAAALYMGGERTKHGLKINMRSKDAARQAAALFLGMNKETVRMVDGKDFKEASDDELEAIARGEK